MNLQQTKNRIQSIRSTQKITKAMELVSISKVKKAKEIHFQFTPFYQEMITIMNYISNHLEDEKNALFSYNEESNKNLTIIVSSSLGLCGGYNHNLYHFVETQLNQKEDELIIIGIKGIYYFKNQGYKIVRSIEDFPPFHLKEKMSTQLANFVLKKFQQKKYRKIQMIYTKYVNSLTFNPTLVQLLPNIKTKTDNKMHKALLMEPSAKEVCQSFIPFYLSCIIKNFLFESVLSEQASRRVAMENATKNASELEEQLMIEYHKTRQAMITQEISEITGSSS